MNRSTAHDMRGEWSIFNRWLVIAAFVGILAAMSATAASGWLHTEYFHRNCNYVPCLEYGVYGWPLDWRTDAPGSLLDRTEARGWDEYPVDGISPSRFLVASVVWFAFLTPGVILLAVVGWLTTSFVSRRRHPPRDEPQI